VAGRLEGLARWAYEREQACEREKEQELKRAWEQEEGQERELESP
jgi:hypothetical protein